MRTEVLPLLGNVFTPAHQSVFTAAAAATIKAVQKGRNTFFLAYDMNRKNELLQQNTKYPPDERIKANTH